MKIYEILEKTETELIRRAEKQRMQKMKDKEMRQGGFPMNPNDVLRQKRIGDGGTPEPTKMQKKAKKQKYMKPIISPDDLKGLKSFEGKKQAVGETATTGGTSAAGIAAVPGNGFANGGPGTLTRAGTTNNKKEKKKKKKN